MITKRFFMLLAIVATSSLLANGAAAQCLGGYGGYYGFGIGRLYETLDRPLDRRVPYFAAHPPVYYSYPVARPYGYSPFAYMPHVQTPEIVEGSVGPQEIINPYVPMEKQEEAGEDTATADRDGAEVDRTTWNLKTPKPLLITNPYMQSIASSSESVHVQVAHQVR